MEKRRVKTPAEKTLFDYLFEPFEDPEEESEAPEGSYEFSTVELSPHINIIMGPINKERVKYIAIEMVSDEKEESTFLVANRIDHFNRFTARLSYQMIMIEFINMYMEEADALHETFDQILSEAIDKFRQPDSYESKTE